MDVVRLAKKALMLLESEAEVMTVFPILKRLTPELEKLYGKVPFPSIHLDIDNHGWWYLWTTIPDVDYTHEVPWNNKKQLTQAENKELRNHLSMILKTWIAEDDLYTPAMEMQDAVKLLKIGEKITKKPSIESRVKTLNRHIKNGVIRAIKVNKNMVRLLKTDIL
jgi:hypothetical protein